VSLEIEEGAFMNRLEDYFRDEQDAHSGHPLLRYLAERQARPDFRDAKVEVVRPRAPLGHKPAKLYLHLYAKSGAEMDRPQAEEWDDELNTALIRWGLKAIDRENEKVRFTLGFRAALEGAEARFGDGYFNGVLVHHIENSPFKDQPEVAGVLGHVYRNGIDASFRSYAECRDMIDGAIRGRARELTKDLGYTIPEAEGILAAAVAAYLDERFSVTSRRALGML
jgi:hypothetical protein